MDRNKDYGKWFVNPAPGIASGSMAQPAVVLCSKCGSPIKPTEDCLERWEYEDEEHNEELTIYLCEHCYSGGRG